MFMQIKGFLPYGGKLTVSVKFHEGILHNREFIKVSPELLLLPLHKKKIPFKIDETAVRALSHWGQDSAYQAQSDQLIIKELIGLIDDKKRSMQITRFIPSNRRLLVSVKLHEGMFKNKEFDNVSPELLLLPLHEKKIPFKIDNSVIRSLTHWEQQEEFKGPFDKLLIKEMLGLL